MAPKEKSTCSKASPQACVFCKREDDDEFIYGKFFHSKQLSVHHNCMFFSSGLEQRTKNTSHGILGFLIEDIRKEVSRGLRLRCTYCKDTGATVGCCIGSCRKTFHFPCGKENSTLHQFFGTFNSYCESHKPVQTFVKTPRNALHCHICYSSLAKSSMEDCLYATCCKNNWYHKVCLQKYATSAGRHFFKCPMCKNSSDFVEVVETYGIYIPEKDASWELEENAFRDLYDRPECGASSCQCDEGRKYDGEGQWELLFCKLCGAKATHKFCDSLKEDVESWQCSDCKVMEDELSKKVVLPRVHLQGTTVVNLLHGQLSQGSSMLNKEFSFIDINLSTQASSLLTVSSLKRALSCVVEITPMKIQTDADGFIKPVITPNCELGKITTVLPLSQTNKKKAIKRLKSKHSENKKRKQETSDKIQELKSKKDSKKVKRKLSIDLVENKKLCLQEKVINSYNNEKLKEKTKVSLLSKSSKKSVVDSNQQPVITNMISILKPVPKKPKKFIFSSKCCSNNSCISKYFGFECPNKKKNTRI